MEKLVRIARSTIERALRGEEIEEIRLGKKAYAFVTIKDENNRLRGCMGSLEEKDLGYNVVRAALLAAFEDPRYPPITLEELERSAVEVSVLSPFRRTPYSEVVVGRDGIVVEYEGKQALLLPQVAIEERMGRDEFLSAACIKAGLDPECYKYATVYTFQAEVYREIYPKGPVVRLM